MPEFVIDCQGLPCPQPVLRCKKYLEQDIPECFEVVVDNEAAKENVIRFLATRGYTAQTSSTAQGIWSLRATREKLFSDKDNQKPCLETCHQTDIVTEKAVVLLTADSIGAGDDLLGAKLVKNFLATLPEFGNSLWRIILLNGGVRLAVSDSPVLEALNTLEAMGVEIFVCGACLEHFDLLHAKKIGQVTNMLDIVTSLQLATKIIRP